MIITFLELIFILCLMTFAIFQDHLGIRKVKLQICICLVLSLIKFKLHDIVMHLNKITTKGWLFDDYYRQTMALIKSVGKSLSTAVSVSDIKYESIL